MKCECEKCCQVFTPGINGGTLVTETDNEYSLCDYCKEDFDEGDIL